MAEGGVYTRDTPGRQTDKRTDKNNDNAPQPKLASGEHVYKMEEIPFVTR